MKFTKKDKKILNDCQAHCSICFQDGGCELQKKIKKQRGKTK